MDNNWKETIEAGNKAFSSGRVAEAERIFVDALKLAEQIDDKHDLAVSLNNLAAIHHTQGKYAQSEEMYKKALGIRESSYGNEHPEIALNLHNLAVLYSARRMYQSAEEYYKKALFMKEKLYGPSHKELVSTLIYYAKLLKILDRLAELRILEDRIQTIDSESKEEASQNII